MVSLELRESEVTELADVVFPVAPVVEKAGAYLNWEGRIRPFKPALHTNAIPDLRVLHYLADEIGIDLGLSGPDAADSELARLGAWTGPRTADPSTAPAPPAVPGAGQAVLASWRLLLDAGRLQDGEPHLARTAVSPVVRLSPATAAELDAAAGRSGNREHRARIGHLAAGGHRDARPRGVACPPIRRGRRSIASSG